MKRISVFLALFLMICGTATAQSQATELAHCGYTGFSPRLTAYLDAGSPSPRSSMPITLPLRIHVVGETDGDGYISLARLFDALNLLNEDFATADINFCIDGDINYINNSSYYNHDFTIGGTMMALNNDPGVINVYFVENPASACGYYSPGRDAIAMSNSCTSGDDHTWAHEMGHFLTLPHTFVGWEGEFDNNLNSLPINSNAPNSVNGRTVERVNGTNCAFAADRFCDTPVDFLSFRWPCNSAGVYSDSLLDPNGTRFAVEAWPIMGYANDNCVERFSDEQRAAMVFDAQDRNIDYNSPILDAEVADASAIEQLGPETEFEALDVLEATLEWTAAPNADFYVVQITNTPFFGINPFIEKVTTSTSLTLDASDGIQIGTRYRWRIRPINRCNVGTNTNVSSTSSFRITDVVSNTQDAELNAAISVFPNPVAAGQNSIRISATELADANTMHLEMIATDGRYIKAVKDIPVVAGRLQFDLPVGNVPAGIYFLRMQQGNRLVTRRVVVTH